jgi:two-component system, OmpR family, sensor histidine kinase VicK
MSNSIHILFVEDSDTEIQMMLQELRQGGYNPTYHQVNSAIMMQLALQQHTWDIVICSYSLLHFSALQALQIIQETKLDLPCIVLSNTLSKEVSSEEITSKEVSSEEIAVEIMRAGATDYLLKKQKYLKRLVPALSRALQEADGRRAKQQAEASALQLAAIVESTEDAIISTDLKGRVLTWNSGAEKLYGYSASEVQGQQLVSLIQPNSDALLSVPPESTCVKVIDCRQVTQRHKSGELIEVLLTVSLIRDPSGNVSSFALVARDISERQLIQRLQDEFISVINHELRTPLASLQGSVELLLTGKLGDLSEQGQRMLQIAANNIDRLVDLTSNILDLEALTSGKAAILKQPHDIGQLLSQAAVDRQAMACKRGIQLVVVPSSIQVALDPTHILQVLHHLIANAIRFSPAGGQVWLDVKLQENSRINTTQPPYALISVKDQGQGIPPHQLETIFEQFQQGDTSDSRRPGGVGLGLAICRNIVQQHQGRLWVESTIGQGSTFYLALPAQRVAVQT